MECVKPKFLRECAGPWPHLNACISLVNVAIACRVLWLNLWNMYREKSYGVANFHFHTMQPIDCLRINWNVTKAHRIELLKRSLFHHLGKKACSNAACPLTFFSAKNLETHEARAHKPMVTGTMYRYGLINKSITWEVYISYMGVQTYL